MRTTWTKAKQGGQAAAALVALLLAAVTALAQPRPAPASPKAPGPPRFEVGAGASWLGGYGLGSRDATLTGNSGGQVVLFRTETDIGAGPGFNVQVGYWVTQRIEAEAAFEYGRPELRTSISGDFEQAPSAVAAETLSQYLLEGVVRVHVAGEPGSRRARSPFASVGVGYLRQLTSDAFAVETGAVFHVGAGLAWTLGTRPRGVARAWGARLEARANWRSGGFDVEDRTRVWPSAGGGVFVRF